MIVFVTLLLGLISGPLPIHVTVEGPVATVEYILDGTVVTRAEYPPWGVTVDFGPALQPRELVARALDKDGNEIARATRWVNLPRPPAEAEKRGSAVSTELTAVPVRIPEKAAQPTPESLQGRLSSSGRPLSVAAIDDGPAKVLIVRVPGTSEAYERLVPPRPKRVDRHFLTLRTDPNARRHEMCLDPEDTVRLLFPTASGPLDFGVSAELFDTSGELTHENGGLFWFLTRTAPGNDAQGDQRIADAVAVAGLQAATGDHRRAVVLVLGSDLRDTSRYDPATVRRYLESTRVPLFVWSLEEPKDNSGLAAWGEVEDISSVHKLYKAYNRLKSELEAQRIVWVEGRHLPQSITLAPGTMSVELLQPRAP
ncbi:MAG TPA: hypothetical protein VE685_15480 [Thermoanaerobaculia bacterium]|nr:hypothetical protein [Thermoanaerobaculia bacterium]